MHDMIPFIYVYLVILNCYLSFRTVLSAAKLQKEYSTQSLAANTTLAKIKNNNYLCFPFCYLRLLGVLVSKIFMQKKQISHLQHYTDKIYKQ